MTYWEDRFALLEQAQNKTGMDTYRDIEKVLTKTQKEIDKEIEKWIYRIATNNELSMTDARKLLNSKELKEFKWDVKQYIKHGEENAISQQWMKELENASAKFHISRLEALKIQTQQALEVAYGNQLDSIDGMMRKVYTDNYYHTAYEIQKGLHIGFDVGQINENKLNKVLKKPWTTDGKTFSDRIWIKKNQMVGELHQQITRQVVQGKKPDVAIKEMQKYVDSSMKNAKYYASRLVMTEQAFIASASTKDSYENLDVEMYEILATLDSKTSEVCQEMDGKVFEMKDFSIGATAPPFHVWCRTTTIPHFDDNFTGERIARGEDGKTYYVPDSMKYQDWKDCFVDHTKDPADFLKVIENVTEVVEELKEIIQAKTVDEAKTLLVDNVGFVLVEDSVKKIDDELFIANTNQLIKLEEKFGAVHQSRSTICSVPSSGASAYVSNIITNPSRQNLSLCPRHFSKKTYALEKEKEYIESGFAMPANLTEDELSIYTVTHEYGHMIQNVLIENEMRSNGWDASKANAFVDMKKRTRDAQYKWYFNISKKVEKDCVDEIIAIAKENNESFNVHDHISQYGKTNRAEFFAEVFANSQLGKPNELGKAMNIWLERKGLIK